MLFRSGQFFRRGRLQKSVQLHGDAVAHLRIHRLSSSAQALTMPGGMVASSCMAQIWTSGAGTNSQLPARLPDAVPPHPFVFVHRSAPKAAATQPSGIPVSTPAHVQFQRISVGKMTIYIHKNVCLYNILFLVEVICDFSATQHRKIRYPFAGIPLPTRQTHCQRGRFAFFRPRTRRHFALPISPKCATHLQNFRYTF